MARKKFHNTAPRSQKKTPVEDKSSDPGASGNASSQPGKDVTAPSTPPADPGGSPSNTPGVLGSTGNAVVLPSSSPASKKARKRNRGSSVQTTDINPPTPTEEACGLNLDGTGPVQGRRTGSWASSLRSMSWSADKSLAGTSKEETTRKHVSNLAEKRDSVISSNWGGGQIVQDQQTKTTAEITKKPRRLWFRPGRWWPCRVYRYIRDFVFAIVHGFQGRRWADFFLSFALLLVCLYVAYVAIDFVIFGLVKGVNAQDMAQDANCSIVYVTIPGPIITVSLIAARPSDPARGTYYYSVVNGTTEWLNSINPPSRSNGLTTSGLITSSSTLPLVLSSLPSYGSSIPPLPGASSTALSMSTPSDIVTTSVLTSTSGSVVLISTITLVPSTVTVSPSLPIPPLSPTASISGAPSPPGQPQPPSPSPVVSTTAFITTPGLIVTSAITNTLSNPTLPLASSVVTVPSTPSSLPGISTGTTTAMLPSQLNSSIAVDQPSTSDTTSTITSVLPGGQTITLTSTYTTPLSGGSQITPPTTILTSTPDISVSTSNTVVVSTTPATSSISIPPAASLPSVLTSTFTVTITSALPEGQLTTLTSTATTIIGTETSFSLPPASPTSSVGISSFSSITPTSNSGGSTVSLPEPSAGSTSGALTSTITLFSSGQTTVITSVISSQMSTTSGSLPLTTSTSSSTNAPSTSTPTSSTLSSGLVSSLSSTSSSAPVVSSPSLSVISSSISSSGTGSPSVTASIIPPLTTSTSSNATLVFPITSFPGPTVDPSPSSGTLPASSSLLNSTTSSLSLSTSPVTELLPTTGTLSTTTTVSPALSTSSSSSNSVSTSQSSTISSAVAPSPISPPLGTTTVLLSTTPSSIMTAISSSIALANTTSSSTNTSPSVTSGSMTSSFSSSSLASPLSSSSSPIVPVSPTSPSGNLTTSSLVTSSSTSSGSSALGSSVSSSLSGGLSAATGTPTIIAPAASSGTVTSTMTLTTAPPTITPMPAPGSDDTSALQARALMTRIVSYGNTSYVFVFPTPSIMTTHTYWTGSYPTVTGPEPSDIATIPLTTRSERQTPLSELPSFELFASMPSSFTTVVNTVVRAAAIPTGTGVVAAPEPTECGESGNFTLNFDDMTVWPIENNLIVVNGMNNPYHHLFYANGYTYVPDKWEPYPSISQSNIAMFLPLTGRLLPNTAFAGTLLPGELGAGPRASVTAYWFNAYSGFFGCALSGLTPCTLVISGYRYDSVLQQEVLVAEQNTTLPACWAYVDCQLTQVFFDERFRALSGIQFNAYTYNLGIPQVHMMDDLRMEWYNNTCAAGIWRIGHL